MTTEPTVNAWTVGASFRVKHLGVYREVLPLINAELADKGIPLLVRVGRTSIVPIRRSTTIDNVRYQPAHDIIGHPTYVRDLQRGTVWFGFRRPTTEDGRAELACHVRDAKAIFARLLNAHRVAYREEVLKPARFWVNNIKDKL